MNCGLTMVDGVVSDSLSRVRIFIASCNRQLKSGVVDGFNEQFVVPLVSKGTPFEQDTTFLFRHRLVQVQDLGG